MYYELFLYNCVDIAVFFNTHGDIYSSKKYQMNKEVEIL